MSDLTPGDGHCSRCGRPFSDNIRDVLLPSVEEIKTASKDTLDYSDREASDLRDAMYAVVTRQSPALTEDMIERAAREFAHTPWDKAPEDLRNSIRHMARRVLEAALADRVVVDLPEPNHGAQIMADGIAVGEVTLAEIEQESRQYLANVREARRLAAEGGEPREQ